MWKWALEFVCPEIFKGVGKVLTFHLRLGEGVSLMGSWHFSLLEKNGQLMQKKLGVPPDLPNKETHSLLLKWQ